MEKRSRNLEIGLCVCPAIVSGVKLSGIWAVLLFRVKGPILSKVVVNLLILFTLSVETWTLVLKKLVSAEIAVEKVR